MQRWQHHLFTLTIVLNLLLGFFVFFEDGLQLPAWLQVAGRMHPLLLHFPVVLIVIYLLLLFILPVTPGNNNELIRQRLLLLAAFTAVVTAIMGLFLSLEEGYDAAALRWHKWSGVLVSFFVCGWYYLHHKTGNKKTVSVIVALIGVGLVTYTGHEGASLTHGEGFLLAPLAEKKKQAPVSVEDANVFTHLVLPVLEEKCMSCHNEKKAKGELIMSTQALLLKGGKNGVLWDTTAADLGLLLRRVHLPEEDEEHMPPAGKVQLTNEEISILTAWIKKGADFNLQVAALPETDTLRMIANRMLGTGAVSYDFAAADASTIKKLNTENRIVTEEAMQSPALQVQFFNGQLFKSEQLKELDAVRRQIVSLDLSRMPVTDADLTIISRMENLRKLFLNFTPVNGSGLAALDKLNHLHTLSLSGTALSADGLQQLRRLTHLKKIYLWNVPVANNALADLKKQLPKLQIETGFAGDTSLLTLSPPVILNEEQIITGPTPLQLKHYIQGTEIRYTLDGTEPDSIQSLVYQTGISIEGNVTIKAKAYKKGWHSSNIATASFFQAKHTPDSTILLIQPDPSYSGAAGKLTDRQKGSMNFRDGQWLAWRTNRMEAAYYFNQPTTMSSVQISVLVDIESYIMPPQMIEIWGGDDAQHLRLLGKAPGKQPLKSAAPYTAGVECRFNPVQVRYIKLVGIPVSRLPSWHRGKGDKGWIFTDEVFFN